VEKLNPQIPPITPIFLNAFADFSKVNEIGGIGG